MNIKATLIPATIALLLGGTSITAQADSLLQVYQAAIANDPQLRAARAELEARKYSQQQSTALYLPNVILKADTTRTDQQIDGPGASDTEFTSSTFGLTLTQPLYRKDHMSRIDQAGAALDQQEALYQQSIQDLTMRLVDSYFDVLAARDSLQFAESEKEAISRQLEQTKQRFEVGLIAITDVHEIQAAYDLATANEILARNDLAAARQALQEITGSAPQTLNPLRESMTLESPNPADVERWLEIALAHNHSIAAARWATEVRRKQIDQARAERHPTVDLVANHSNNDISDGTFDGRETDSSSIGIQLQMPLFTGGRIKATVAEAKQNLVQSKENLEQARRAVERETRNAYLNVEAGISRVNALKQAVVSSQSALTATEAGYEVGTRTTVDVLDSRRELFRAQRDYARARYDYVIATLRLKKAVGSLGMQDIENLDQWLN